jgi:hypothetical protein
LAALTLIGVSRSSLAYIAVIMLSALLDDATEAAFRELAAAPLPA